MAGKKSGEPEKPSEETELVKHVDEMMSVDHEAAETDVSKLAEDVNKQIMSAEAVDGHKVEVKTSAPEVPDELKVPDDPGVEEITEEPAKAVPDIPDSEEKFDDAQTDEAVDDIVAKEGDTVLAVEDARRKKSSIPVGDDGWKSKLKAFFKNKWTWVGLLLLLIVIFAVPFTRYRVLGLVIKKDVTITVVDSKTSSPVSSAEVQLAGDVARTDEEGHAKLHAGIGDHKIIVDKKYYTSYDGKYFVGFSKKASQDIKLVATGRLVPVTVTNKITGKPIVGAAIEIKGTTAKTNSKGQADIGLPVKEKTYKGIIKLNGYNTSDITVEVTDKSIKENTFGLVPAGKIYFLSNLNGTLDVVKSNLDGSARKVVLEGTGSEQPAATSLLASRDWRYLVLKARRDTAQAALYLIDTNTDKVTPFDNTNSEFELVGWYGHSFIYSLTKNGSDYWVAGRQAVKSYDADHQQLNQLDQVQAEGTQANYAYQDFFNFYILNGAVTYNTQWYTYNSDDAGKTNSIRAVQPNGQNKKDYQTFPTPTTGYIQAALYEPQAVYYAVFNKSENKINYYEFENLAVKPASVDQSTFDQGYPTFLLSPSGNKTFWTELRDGKSALFTGSANAASKKQIASLSDYSPYGWYSDNYVLVSKNNSQLYIMSPINSSEPPLKITDYYKPAQTFQGYGYGYGGL